MTNILKLHKKCIYFYFAICFIYKKKNIHIYDSIQLFKFLILLHKIAFRFFFLHKILSTILLFTHTFKQTIQTQVVS